MTRFGLFFPNFGPFGDPDVLMMLASEAERSGWGGFFIWDHILFEAEDPQNVVDPWVALAGVAMATQTIRLGALITPLARRRPWKVARETATLDRLSSGRLIFAAGLGFPPYAEFELFGENADNPLRAEKLDEGLEIVAGLWSGEEFSFSGNQYEIGRTRFLPTPKQQPRPPIWIAGWWPRKAPFRRAARWDGVFPELKEGAVPSPQDLREIIAYVQQHRTREDAFDVVMNGYTSEDTGEASSTVAPYIAEGLTWWLERIDPTRLFSVEEARQRIVAGPPSA